MIGWWVRWLGGDWLADERLEWDWLCASGPRCDWLVDIWTGRGLANGHERLALIGDRRSEQSRLANGYGSLTLIGFEK